MFECVAREPTNCTKRNCGRRGGVWRAGDGRRNQIGRFVWVSNCIAFGWGSGCWPIGRLHPTTRNKAIALGEVRHNFPCYIFSLQEEPHFVPQKLLHSPWPHTLHITTLLPPPKHHKGKYKYIKKTPKQSEQTVLDVRGNKKPYSQINNYTDKKKLCKKTITTWTCSRPLSSKVTHERKTE